MIKKVALIGYSGHAYVVIDVLKLLHIEIAGYYEPEIKTENPYNLSYLGNDGKASNLKTDDPSCSLFVAIGNNVIRRTTILKLIDNNISIQSIISPTAIVSQFATVAKGSFVSHNATINPFVTIGMGGIVNTGAVIEHEAAIGDFSHIAPGAVVLGNVRVGSGSFIGANSVIKQGVRIGDNVTIGAGSVVIHDVPDNQIWAGNPAKTL